ncbi:TraR/DksA family transcriptional regulator [Streptomyces sp. NPDC056149]|uniref:TraR/DksA family transcriptional regulator n=1 Tax=unclassified Streptomyces TaxID=2593676 RepID=UPI002380EA55|nr:TraR/DksA C4-type zinc finger protein [Streptomyces sp. WZ-12]
MVAKKTAAEKTTTSAGPADEDVATHSAHEGAAGHPEAPKKTAAKKAAAKKAPAKKAAPAKAAAKKTAAKKTARSTAKSATKKAVKKVAEKPVEKAPAGEAAVAARAAAAPGELAVRPGEDPWTPAEVAEARTELTAETDRLRAEIVAAEDAIAGLMRDSGDGAGDDEADTGTKNITREHELALASNAREMLHQTERALGRLDAGTYGLCENCGQPIGKARMQAFPRATLCVECKQRQERR